MRSRSSRLFVVMVNLVGISTNLPGSNLFYSSYFSSSNSSNGFGIVGVHPMTILFESLELDAAGGLDQLLQSLDSAGYDVDLAVLGEPYWLQDDTDGKCLGPTGFSECGDATLWLLRRRTSNNNSKTIKQQHDSKVNRGLRNVGGILSKFLKRDSSDSSSQQEDPSYGYALELIDVHSMQQQQSFRTKNKESDPIQDTSKQRKRPRRQRTNNKDTKSKQHNDDDEGECLLAYNKQTSQTEDIDSYNIKDVNNDESEQNIIHGMSTLTIGPCSSQEAWLWKIDGDGVLIWDESITGSKKKKKRKQNRKVFLGGKGSTSSGHQDNSPKCVWRANETFAVAGPCSDTRSTTEDTNHKLIGFSLVQYQTTSALSPKLPRHPKVTATAPLPETVSSHLPSSVSSYNSRSYDNDWSTPVAGNLVTQNTASTCPSEIILEDRTNSGSQGDEDEKEHIPRSVRTSQSHAVLGPLLHPELKPASQYLSAKIANGMRGGSVVSQYGQKKTASLDELQDRTTPSLGGGVSGIGRMVPKKPTNKLLHQPHSIDTVGSQDNDDAPHRTRKIPVHPYIEASKGSGIWKDPQTDLNYATDLCEYLGHERKETGRHTLMGVGQYTRTMLKIKVYGISFYVAKRDALADPVFKRYAHLSSEDLQKRPDFYDHLMQSPVSAGSNGKAPCVVDRTLVLNLNMQLSTETLRSSLDADWKLLSPEHKQTLIAASFEDRPANEKMLKKIESDENPSNCSCGQKAPDQYNADQSCCARGTELVFTWRKNGHMELRLDGRLLKTFEDPEIGKAILYEYLREDNPMSPDARNHFSDGFPFLLAPLAQLRDITSPLKPFDGTEGENSKSHRKDEKAGNFINSFGENMGKQADDFMEWLHVNTRGGLTNVAKVANGVVEGTNNIGGELEKRRILLWKQMQSIPEQSLNTFSTLLPLGKKKKNLDIINFEEFTNLDSVSKNRSSNVSMLLGDVSQHSTVPISDEIGVIIHPTMNFTHVLFGTMVHLYLMLLLIVSVPGSSSTKMIVKRSNNSTGDSETDSCMSNECSKQNSDSDSYERRDPYENSLSSSDLAGIELSLDVHPKKKNSYQQLKFLSSSSFEEPGDTDEQQLASSNSETPEPPQVENINPTNNSRRNSPTKMKKALSYFV